MCIKYDKLVLCHYCDLIQAESEMRLIWLFPVHRFYTKSGCLNHHTLKTPTHYKYSYWIFRKLNIIVCNQTKQEIFDQIWPFFLTKNTMYVKKHNGNRSTSSRHMQPTTYTHQTKRAAHIAYYNRQFGAQARLRRGGGTRPRRGAAPRRQCQRGGRNRRRARAACVRVATLYVCERVR